MVLGAVVTPFDYEGSRIDKAARAVGYLQCEADLVLPFSNQEWASRHSMTKRFNPFIQYGL